MKWTALALIGLTACATLTKAPDGFPVVQSDVGGHMLSCKGTRCCWPWDSDGRVVVCIEPTEGNYLGAGGVMITIRGKMP